MFSTRLLLLPLTVLTTASAQTGSVFFETSAKAYDKAVTVRSDGGSGIPFAQVTYTVNTTFPLRNIGTTQGTATAIAGGRHVGVKLEGEGLLNTQLNTGFGVELKAKAQVIDVFIMDARYPDGTPVSAGFLGFNAVAQGQVDLYGSTTLFDFSTAELNYTLSVGGLGAGSDNILKFATSTTSPRIVARPLAGVVPWIQGTPIQIIMMVDASIDAKLEASGTFDGIVEFDHSLEWAGIVSVTDGDGVPITDFSALSPETGVDWGPATLEPIPEPALLALWASLLLGSSVFATRRRR